MKRYKYEILSGVTGTTFQVPIFLEASVDEMGVMVGFDGEMEQVEQFANFTYKSVPDANAIQVTTYNNGTEGLSIVNVTLGATNCLPTALSEGQNNSPGITAPTGANQTLSISFDKSSSGTNRLTVYIDGSYVACKPGSGYLISFSGLNTIGDVSLDIYWDTNPCQ